MAQAQLSDDQELAEYIEAKLRVIEDALNDTVSSLLGIAVCPGHLVDG